MAGDYNLDLLRCDSSAAIGDIFYLICSLGTFPKITLPTRLTSHSCTLIDNFFCKHSNVFSELKAGILIHKLSDHQPYFLSIPFKYCHVSTVKSSSDSSVKRPLRKSEIPIFKEKVVSHIAQTNFSSDPSLDPNENCDRLCNLLSDAYSTSLQPSKRLGKHKQPRTPWITQGLLRSIRTREGLLRSIRTRDKLYSKILKCDDINKCNNLETQLKNHRKILRRTCNLAKTSYYKNLFDKSKNDYRKMWCNLIL